ncbi:MAG: hypothetical protein CMJ25_28190 [Phycisphaerae bacterium]|nr:hypothetical protein [Phycisphaerae bacterium]|tara:strand:+ start:5327 stop:6460 length:1134 start_codon:yes stop_codon:yes gene_type:complete
MQLTLEQINQLAAMDFPMNGVAPGAEATADEIAALGLQPDVGPNVSDDLSAPAQASPVTAQPTMAPPVASQPTMDPAAASAAMAAVPAPAPVTQAQLQQPESGGFMDTIFGPKGETDQFSNLNRNQRMMLAFGAMRDAGMALQGKNSSAFTDTLKQINAQSDMRRKAQAVQAKNSLLSAFTGGSGDADARRQQILNAAAQGLIDGPTAKLMIEELDRQKTEKTEIAGKAALIARIDALMNDPNLEDALGFEGIVRGFASTVGLDPNVARVNEMIKQIRGDVFLQAFEKLKGGGQITELEGQKAEQAMARLGQMQGYDDYVNSLKELRFYVDIFSRRMQGESIPDEMIYTPGQGTSGGSTPPLSDADLDDLYPPTPAN